MCFWCGLSESPCGGVTVVGVCDVVVGWWVRRSIIWDVSCAPSSRSTTSHQHFCFVVVIGCHCPRDQSGTASATHHSSLLSFSLPSFPSYLLFLLRSLVDRQMPHHSLSSEFYLPITCVQMAFRARGLSFKGIISRYVESERLREARNRRRSGN